MGNKGGTGWTVGIIQFSGKYFGSNSSRCYTVIFTCMLSVLFLELTLNMHFEVGEEACFSHFVPGLGPHLFLSMAHCIVVQPGSSTVCGFGVLEM